MTSAIEALKAAIAFETAGNLPRASASYQQAVELARNNAELLALAAEGLRRIGRITLALAIFDEALTLDGNAVGVWYGKALALEANGLFADARSCFERVIALAPHTPHGFAGAASVSVAMGNISDAQTLTTKALAVAPQDFLANFVQAQCAMKASDFAEAAAQLSALAARLDIAPQDRIRALALLGRAHEAMGKFDHAFKAWQDANTIFANAYPLAGTPSALHRVESLTAAIEDIPDGAPLTGARSTPTQPHIFVLGFPRSGSTLVEQILRSVPGVVTSEEEPTLADAADRYLTPEGLTRLSTMPAQEEQELRDLYWRRVEEAGVALGGAYVDMDPLKTTALPLIAKLFPHARVVFVRRDPRDVIFSCFRQSFAFSLPTAEFVTLDGTARYYDALMRFAAQSTKKFPLNIFELSYEQLVTNFDDETRKLCDFVGLPWSPDLSRFSEIAQKGGVRTASTAQVMQPLFDGRAQWTPYADKMAPLDDLLQPWIDKIG